MPDAEKHGEAPPRTHSKQKDAKHKTGPLNQILRGSEIGVYPLGNPKEHNSGPAGRDAPHSIPLRVGSFSPPLVSEDNRNRWIEQEDA